MKYAECDVSYQGYTEPQGEPIRPPVGVIKLDILDNGLPVASLRANISYSDPVFVSNFSCSNSSFLESDLISIMNDFNMYTVATGGDTRFSVRLTASVLGESLSAPVVQTNVVVRYTQSGWTNVSSVYFVGFETGLYDKLLDTTNVFQTLNSLLSIPSPQLSDDEYKIFRASEAYNTNVLLTRINDSLNSLNVVSGGQASNVDLSTINTQLTNIANNLKVVEKDDQQQDIDVSIAEIEKNKQLYVVNNIDIADKLSMKPKFNGYPDDEEVL